MAICASMSCPRMRESWLDFSNHWYKAAMENAQNMQLENGLMVMVVTAPFFLGTKLEAFKGRGKNDYFASHDLEDLIAVIDGRPSLLGELQSESKQLRAYVANEVRHLLKEYNFIDALPHYLLPDPSSQSRLGRLLATLRAIAELLRMTVQLCLNEFQRELQSSTCAGVGPFTGGKQPSAEISN